ncbi:hypothetical protein MCOR04_009633, partial [Pyricularia oryzae]
FLGKYPAAQLLRYICSDIRKFVEPILRRLQDFACYNQAKSNDIITVKLPET